MKIKSNKGFLFLVSAVFLCYLIISCRDPVQLMDFNKNSDQGYFSFSLNGEDSRGNRRTILPQTVIQDFRVFTFEFFAVGPAPVPYITVDRNYANLSDPIALVTGTWDLHVTTYIDDFKTRPAAFGSLNGIVISAGLITAGSVILYPVTDGISEGIFSWDIGYPAGVNAAYISITPLFPEGTYQQHFITGSRASVSKRDSLSLLTGQYRILIMLQTSDGLRAVRSDILHIYRNLESFFKFDFTTEHFVKDIRVLNSADSGAETLRDVLLTAPDNSWIIIDDSIDTITLFSPLPLIDKNIVIEGNGVTISSGADFNGSFLRIFSCNVTINRVWFKGNGFNRAISNDSANLTMESCIFSGFNISGNGGAINNFGQAGSLLDIKSCTFYGNAANAGAAVFNDVNSTILMTGNLFSLNNQAAGPSSVQNRGTVISGGGNVFDISMEGASMGSNDKIVQRPFINQEMKVLSGGDADNIVTVLPSGYPSYDFYGSLITAPASAGAVQAKISGLGYYLVLSLNDSSRGSVRLTQTTADSFYAAPVTITADFTDDNQLIYWLVNGKRQNALNPLTLTLTEHTHVRAVFAGVITVTSGADSGPGTLRQAILDAKNGDLIRINLAAPDNTITLESWPSLTINKNVIIEGNGVRIDTGTLQINTGNAVTINRVWLRNFTNRGNLTLESCIMSRQSYIVNRGGSLNLKGCTIYGITGYPDEGAIWNTTDNPRNSQGTVTMTGNLFYGNSSHNRAIPAVFLGGTVVSGGNNISDTAFVQVGSFFAHPGDIITKKPFINQDMKILSGTEADNLITEIPADYPMYDFYGNPITAPASPGAIQAKAEGSGFYLFTSVNNDRGTISIISPSASGFYTGSVTVAVETTSGFSWNVNGIVRPDLGSTNPLTLTLTEHTHIQAVFANVITVTSNADSGPNTLRQAISDAQNGDIIQIQLASPNIITLSSGLISGFNANYTIEGNGVIITFLNQDFLRIQSNASVTIRRVWFQDINNSAIIIDGYTSLTLESCIFSGNRSSRTGSHDGGGAIYNSGILNIKGCTFYGNNAALDGGAIYNAAANITMTGNLFYANYAELGEGNSIFNLIVDNGGNNYSAGRIFSNGFNVLDSQIEGEPPVLTPSDIFIQKPVVTQDMKILSGAEADSIITVLPADYPAYDFFGNPITAPASAGAVQEKASGTGYYLDLGVDDRSRGSINVQSPSADGFYTGSVTINATSRVVWYVNGIISGSSQSLTLNLTEHTFVRAVFRAFFVTSSADSGANTLRQAIIEGRGNYTIYVDLPENNKTITLLSPLPNLVMENQIRPKATVEGNGVIITASASPSNNSFLWVVSQVRLTIKRVWFKDIKGYTGIFNNFNPRYGNIHAPLNFISCIFSGNQTDTIIFNGSTNLSFGGYTNNVGDTAIFGCTFYDNVGTITQRINLSSTSSYLFLAGNLFYGNAVNIYNQRHSVIESGGFNVFDSPISGSYPDDINTPHPRDKVTDRPVVAPSDMKILSGSDADSIITALPVGYPVFDFYGNRITAPASAGAVQEKSGGAGYFLNVSVNDSSKGSIHVPPPGSGGFFTGSVTLTATRSALWFVNGIFVNDSLSITLNMTEHTNVYAIFSNIITVTSNADSGPNTLRQALLDSESGGIIRVELTGTEIDRTIILQSPLRVEIENLKIEGNGVILTRDTSSYSGYGGMYVQNVVITISGIWFKGFTDYAFNMGSSGILTNVTFESCIFSGNSTSWSGAAIRAYPPGSLNIRGCTFYNNIASSPGAAIWTTVPLTLTGNVFYGNHGPDGAIEVYQTTAVSSFNVFDSSSPSNSFKPSSRDIVGGIIPFVTADMKVIQGMEADRVIVPLPVGYPQTDFFGNRIISPASAGAVQERVHYPGFYLGLIYNSSDGNISVSGSGSGSGLTSSGGFYTGTVTITANPGSGKALSRWLVNGVYYGNSNPLTLTLTNHTTVEAVFGRLVTVTSPNDSGNNTLRQAMSNMIDEDVIRITLPPPNTITLNSPLPSIQSPNYLCIEGNSVIITASGILNASLISIQSNSGEQSQITIKDVWFRNINSGYMSVISSGRAAGRAGHYLTLESCIFSNISSSNAGGAINNVSGLNLNGCTFYGNYSSSVGGAIFHSGPPWSVLTMTGNIFYGNTASALESHSVFAPVQAPDQMIVSNGYNVFDYYPIIQLSGVEGNPTYVMPLHPRDKVLLIPPFVNPSDMKVTQGSGAENIITSLPAGYPRSDFYGNPITAPASAGAVQEAAAFSGYYLLVGVNASDRGMVLVTTGTASGFNTGPVTLQAFTNGTNYVKHWLVNGINRGNQNPFTLTLTEHSYIQAVFDNDPVVTSNADSGPGTLRQAILDSSIGDTIRINLPGPDKTITLLSPLLINKSLTIEGNGVILTAVSLNDSLMRIEEWTNTTIRGVWFKDIKPSYGVNGAAIRSINVETLTLESCIFSGNQVEGAVDTWSGGGAIYCNAVNLNVKGCTFYNNTTNNYGGAIFSRSNSLTLTGNIFYGNTAFGISNNPGNSVHVTGSFTSNGFNVFDFYPERSVPSLEQFPVHNRDRIVQRPFINQDFRVITNTEADNILTSLPADYPQFDFYGNPVTAPAAAGAVQSRISSSGRYLNLSSVRSGRGTISVTSGSGSGVTTSGGFYTGAVTITAQANSGFALLRWIVNGAERELFNNSNSLTINLAENTHVRAVFASAVTSPLDSGAGSLRQVITDAPDNDVIMVTLPPPNTISLNSTLPIFNKSLTIEGNGVTITTSGTVTQRLININMTASTSMRKFITIKRVWFKDITIDGTGLLTSVDRNRRSLLTLESCIFSGIHVYQLPAGNMVNANIINLSANANIKGCTFYNNSYGGAGSGTGIIYVNNVLYSDWGATDSPTVTMTGNLFYGNISDTSSTDTVSAAVISRIITNGYNVHDNGGWNTVSTDLKISESPFSNTNTLTPTTAMKGLIPPGAWSRTNMPAFDLYGAPRTWSTTGAPGAVE